MAEIQPLLIHTITWTSNAHMCSCRHMNHRSSEAQTHVTDDFLRYLWIGLVWSSCFLNQNVSICIKIIIWMCKKQIMMLQKGILILICVTNTLSRCLFFLVLGVSRYKQSCWCMRTDDSHRRCSDELSACTYQRLRINWPTALWRSRAQSDPIYTLHPSEPCTEIFMTTWGTPEKEGEQHRHIRPSVVSGGPAS